MVQCISNQQHEDWRLERIQRARISTFENGEVAKDLSPQVKESWQRCMNMGLNPRDRVIFDPVSSAKLQLAREKSFSLINASQPVIKSLKRALLHTRYFAMLTDAEGIVLDVHGFIDQQDKTVQAIARPGVDLSERKVGTTAIGSCLTDGEPTWLHRGEHFFEDNQVFSCAGAPICGPQGVVLGMLDLTGFMVPEQPALLHLVTQSICRIENALTLATPHALLLRLNWPGRLLGDEDDGLLCFDELGNVVGFNRSSAMMLELSLFDALPNASDLFALDTNQLFDLATTGHNLTEVQLWSGLRLQVHAHRPIRSTKQLKVHALPLREMETAMIRKALEDAKGNVMAAAQALGISRATIYRRLGRK